MKILTSAQMREVDRLTTERYGIPSSMLMENAGGHVARFVADRLSDLKAKRIVVLCGKGNNGGDGLVAARMLHLRGARPVVFLFAVAGELQGDAAVNLEKFKAVSADLRIVRTPDEWRAAQDVWGRAEILVDALLGTGLRGGPQGLLAEVIRSVRARGPKGVISVDIPSGVSSDTGEILGEALEAEATVTFTAPKVGQFLHPGAQCVGRLVVADIGSPREVVEQVSESKLRWLEPGELGAAPDFFFRRADSHKGDFGHAIIVAGSLGKSGAAVLAGTAALRVGAGLVTVATPEPALPIVAASWPELMTEPLPATEGGAISLRAFEYGRFDKVLEGKTFLAMGPGLSQDSETQQFVRKVATETPLPILLDADALNAFVGHTGEFQKTRSSALILTPHPGEMARLLGCTSKDVQGARINLARKAAAEWRAYVVLKGQHTVVSAPDGRVWINSTGNPGMASGGMGDVLTGLLAGLLAQKKARLPETLNLGVFLHGLAGDIAAEEAKAPLLLASELIHSLPAAMEQVRVKRNDD